MTRRPRSTDIVVARVKHAGGRPSKYKEGFADQARKLCLLGATDSDLASFFEVNEDTINEWKKVHLEFSESLKAGKDLADATVADRLYKRATGYEHADVDIKVVAGQIVQTGLIKHYPPDTPAAIFWLKNRQKDKWRDRQEVDHTTKDQPIPLLAGLAPAKLEVEDDAPTADDSSSED